MKILIITPLCPFPPNKNGGIHTLYNLIRANSDHTIDLIYYDLEDKDAEENIRGLVNCVKYVPMRKKSSVAARLFSLIMRTPYAQYQYRRYEIQSIDNYDVIIYDQFPSEPFARAEYKARQICFVHDSMPLFFKRKAEKEIGAIARAYYHLQSRYAIRAERKALDSIDKLVFVSHDDSEYSKTLYGDKNKCSSISLGIDSIDGERPYELGKSIVFSGVMDYAPNEDAALFFLSEVYPSIQRRFRDVRLFFVGRNPTQRLVEACNQASGVTVTGYVDSVFPYILGATVYVSPLRFGSGVKNKVLEAMKCGSASVFSPISIESIPEVEPGKNCLIATSAEEWIECVSMIMSSDNLRHELERNSSSAFENNRSWKSAFDSLLS